MVKYGEKNVSLWRNYKTMVHLVDKEQELPYVCEQCKHHKHGFTCAAFDLIPPDLFFDAEKHNKVISGQNGEFVFSAKEERSKIRSYEFENTPD